MIPTLRTLLDRVEQGEGADWIDHKGGACPVSPHQIVMVRLRDGWTDEDIGGSEADDWEWPWRQDADDVIAYRIVPSSFEEPALLRAKIAQEEGA